MIDNPYATEYETLHLVNQEYGVPSSRFLRNAWLYIGLAILCFVGYMIWTRHDRQGSGYNTEQLLNALRNLNEWNPESDADERIAVGDHGFVACSGAPPGPYFPGVPNSIADEIMKSKNYWTIHGTSDAIESNQHSRLIRRAQRYAERFNRHLRSKIPRPAN